VHRLQLIPDERGDPIGFRREIEPEDIFAEFHRFPSGKK